MRIFNQINDLQSVLQAERKRTRSIGFVPTMGALHEGHLELMRRAKAENELLVASVFVNPIQFNNSIDLEKYPRNLQDDIRLLESVACDVLFNPSVEEMYPEPVTTQYSFGSLEEVMEGAFRPGHFNGVAVVVHKLFEIVQPDKAYFGEKDFQQLAIIRELVRQYSLPVDIVACPTIREADGLAMSSRNQRLLPAERIIAPKIYQILKKGASLRNVLSPKEMRIWVRTQLEKIDGCMIDYVEVADDIELQPIEHWNQSTGARLFVALFLGQVRLIDNIRIF